MKTKTGLAAAAGMVLLSASGCGGGDGSGPTMQVAVADAPVDGAEHVVVKFSGVELTPASGGPVEIDFAQDRSIDLLTQSGMAMAVLFNQPVPAGSYGQIRLKVVADGNPSNSYIQLSDGNVRGLLVPSSGETGLKLVSGFSVPDSGVVDYTIDFDLRKAISCPNGQAACFLKPALRLVDDSQVGNIQGIVDATLITSNCTPGVYLYSGNVSAAEDMNSSAAASDTSQPIASTVPVETSNGSYYQFTFLTAGTYTVAFSCQAAQDDPDQNDNLSFGPVEQGNVVTAGQTTTVNLGNIILDIPGDVTKALNLP